MIYERSLRSEFTANAAGVALATVIFALTIFLIRLLNEISIGKLEIDALGPLLIFAVLKFLPILLSLSSFLGVLLTLTRWYRDSEMTVWLSAGKPLSACIKPIVYFSLPLMLIVGVITQELLPWAYGANFKIRHKMSDQAEVNVIHPGAFRESGDGRRVIFIESNDQIAKRQKNIFVSENRADSQGILVAMTARQALHDNGDRFVVLENGHRYELSTKDSTVKEMAFEEYAIRVGTKIPSVDLNQLDGLSTRDLLRLATPQSLGDVVTRVGLVLMVLVLPLLAIPLSFVNPRASRSVGLVMALLIYFLYYNLMTLARAWVMHEKVPFILGLVAPHLMMFLLFLGLFHFKPMRF